MPKTRSRYTPRLSWRPIVPVRWRSHSHAYSDEVVRLRWVIYLFGIVPIARLPRRRAEVRS